MPSPVPLPLLMAGLDRLDQELRRQGVVDEQVKQLARGMAQVCEQEDRLVAPDVLVKAAHATVAPLPDSPVRGWVRKLGWQVRGPQTFKAWYDARRRWTQGLVGSLGTLMIGFLEPVLDGGSVGGISLACVALPLGMVGVLGARVVLRGLRPAHPNDQQRQAWRRHASLKDYLDQVEERSVPLLEMEASALDRQVKHLEDCERSRQALERWKQAQGKVWAPPELSGGVWPASEALAHLQARRSASVVQVPPLRSSQTGKADLVEIRLRGKFIRYAGASRPPVPSFTRSRT